MPQLTKLEPVPLPGNGRSPALPPLRSPGNKLSPLTAPPPKVGAINMNPLNRQGTARLPPPVDTSVSAPPSAPPSAPTEPPAAAEPTGPLAAEDVAAPELPAVAPLPAIPADPAPLPAIPAASPPKASSAAPSTGGGVGSIPDKLRECPASDGAERIELLSQLAAASLPVAWEHYQKMRAADLASLEAAITPPAKGMVSAAAMPVRRLCMFAQKQAVAHDLPLLRASFTSIEPLPELLNTLYLHSISNAAKRSIAAAVNGYRPDGGDNDGSSPANVSWPKALREVAAVCDALSGVDAALLAAAPAELAPPALACLGRAAALGTNGTMLAMCVSEHLEQLVSRAVATEMRDGPTRATWCTSVNASKKPCVLLGAAASVLGSLSLHAGDAVFGALAPLDTALCDGVLSCITRLASHVIEIGEACALVARGLTATERTVDGMGRTAALSPPLRAAAADGALPAVCCATLAQLKSFVHQLTTGELQRARGGAFEWADGGCISKLREAENGLDDAERRMHALVCDGAATLATAPAIEACAPTGSGFWSAAQAWRVGTRCSLPVQHALMQLHTLKAHLGALGDADTARLLYARTLRRSVTALLRAYWSVATPPSEKRALTFTRDLRVLCAAAAAESADGAAPAAPAAGEAETRAASAAAAAAAGVGSPTVEDAPLAVEQQRLGQLALWLLSLLALHHTPLPALAAFMRAAPAGGEGEGSRELDAQISLDALPEGSRSATALLAKLSIPECAAPRDAGLKMGREMHLLKAPPMQDAHKAAMAAAVCEWPEELDWASLLEWSVFPLRAFPHIVKHAARRLPSIQPAGLAAAAAAKPDEVEAAALDSRNALVQMLGMDTPAPAN